MKKAIITRATLGRLPVYLEYIRSSVTSETISAAAIARGLNLGEVQVRKDLCLACGSGRPRIGYQTKTLLADLEAVLGNNGCVSAVIVGAGKLGLALLGYDGFAEYGMQITAAFDCDEKKTGKQYANKSVCPMEQLEAYCRSNHIQIGIITVSTETAQSVCDKMVQSGITAIWNFAPCVLNVPQNITVKQENLALSLAHLHLSANHKR